MSPLAEFWAIGPSIRLHVFVAQLSGNARFTLSYDAGVVHLVDCIAIENGGNDNLTVFQPRHIKAVLLVVVLLVVCRA